MFLACAQNLSKKINYLILNDNLAVKLKGFCHVDVLTIWAAPDSCLCIIAHAARAGTVFHPEVNWKHDR